MSSDVQVWIGNIPFDATEEELKELFSYAGPLVSFRFAYERDTKAFRGFAFCNYKDAESASTACRNLNGYEIHGLANLSRTVIKQGVLMQIFLSPLRRHLRVDVVDKSATKNQSGQVNVEVDKKKKNTVSDDTIKELSVKLATVYHRIQKVDGKTLEYALATIQREAGNNPEKMFQLLSANPELSLLVLHGAYLSSIISHPIIPLPTKYLQPDTMPMELQSVLHSSLLERCERLATNDLANTPIPIGGPTAIKKTTRLPVVEPFMESENKK